MRLVRQVQTRLKLKFCAGGQFMQIAHFSLLFQFMARFAIDIYQAMIPC
jgi:hypothetical protein